MSKHYCNGVYCGRNACSFEFIFSLSLVVDGKSVGSIMKSEDLKDRFLDICQRCPTVVACRLSPIQKSQLVRLIKDADPKNLTAAIGDGGNDISMIQVMININVEFVRESSCHFFIRRRTLALA